MFAQFDLVMAKTVKVKLQLYNTLIHPTVIYASDTWVLMENMINELMTFERKVMRKIFGPTRSDDGYWRINNQEINDLLLTYSMEQSPS
jgi:hypothetical protein